VKQSESSLVKQIIQYLNYLGHYVWRVNTGSLKVDNRFVQFGKKGMSDILGIHKDTGQLIAIECKVGYNKPSQFQKDFLEDINSRNGIAILAYKLEDVSEVFKDKELPF
jgi:hypothetical protein